MLLFWWLDARGETPDYDPNTEGPKKARRSTRCSPDQELRRMQEFLMIAVPPEVGVWSPRMGVKESRL